MVSYFFGAPDTFKSEPNTDFSRSAKVMVSVLSLKLKVITILSSYKNTEFTKLFIKLLLWSASSG